MDYVLPIGMKNLSNSLLFIKCFLHQQGLSFSRFHEKASVDGKPCDLVTGLEGKASVSPLTLPPAGCTSLGIHFTSKSSNPSMENRREHMIFLRLRVCL